MKPYGLQRCIALIVMATMLPFLASADDDPAAMNGYRLEDYKNFLEDWHFVTVRYRRDSGEMRFTYANDEAWKVLQEGGTDYPDGAAFAKFSAITEDDPAFVSSAVPSGVRRYQLMVMDRQKHTETEGWGYALFLEGGMSTREDHRIAIGACHACHQMVPERGYIFSRPINLGIEDLKFVGTRRASPSGDAGLPREIEERLTYTTEPRAALPDSIQSLLPENVTQVRQLRGAMEESAFSGTMDEIRPSLAREVVKSGMPALLMTKAGNLFSLVLIDDKASSCTASKNHKGVAMVGHTSVVGLLPPGASAQGRQHSQTMVRPVQFCHHAEATP